MVNKADTVLAFIECTFYCSDKYSKCLNNKSISSTDKCFAHNGVESNEIGLWSRERRRQLLEEPKKGQGQAAQDQGDGRQILGLY